MTLETVMPRITVRGELRAWRVRRWCSSGGEVVLAALASVGTYLGGVALLVLF